MKRSRSLVLLSLAVGICAHSLSAWGQGGSNAALNTGATSKPSPTTTSDFKLSKAERILRLEQSIESTRNDLAELRKGLDDPESEYAKAKADFIRLDKRLNERKKEAETQPVDPARIEGLTKARELAKERFDLAIQDREAAEKKYALLEKKLQQDTQALAQMKDVLPSLTSQPAQANPNPLGPGEISAQPSEAGSPAGVPAVPPQATVKMPGVPSIPLPTQQTTPSAAGTDQTTAPAMTQELLDAQKEAQAKEAEARKAQEQVKSVAARIATLRESIATEEKILETARKRSANAGAIYAQRRDYAQKQMASGASQEDITKALDRADEAEKVAANAEKEVTTGVERLDALKSELADLQAEHINALEQAADTQKELDKATDNVNKLKNPYSLVRILQWVIDHGPKILGILIGMAALIWMTKFTEHRMVKLIAVRGDSGTANEREARARTLASVFRNVASTAIVVGGMLMILTEVGMNIIPLLGAASVVGLAFAFGAQSLIKDYFSGFIILLENQYAINDVIKIGDLSGMVEHISLRMTVLRDAEGNAHFIPHGEIKSVTNMTHGWSRAVIEVGVSYKEPVDKVMQVLNDLGRELRRDVAFSPLILDDPEMLGVDNLGDSAVVIKLLIKTRPMRQWTVKRELLRRIKNRFDELGIEIPFQCRTVYHRYEAGAPPADGQALSPLPGRKA